MRSLILMLAMALATAWLATRPTGGSWLQELRMPLWAPAPTWLALGWFVAWILETLAGWQAWLTAHRHGAWLVTAWLVQLGLWTLWAWALLDWHRPGWALAVMTGSWLVQLAMFGMARGLGGIVVAALAPGMLWLSLLWLFNLLAWRLNGGGLASLLAQGL